MKPKYIQAAIDAFERWQGFAEESVVPCTEQEIAAMAARLPGGRVPEAYRELLAYGDRKLGGVYEGVDISYEMTWALLSHDYRDVVAMIRPWDREVVLPPELFVLTEHFGSNFTFVRLDEVIVGRSESSRASCVCSMPPRQVRHGPSVDVGAGGSRTTGAPKTDAVVCTIPARADVSSA